MPHLDLNWWNGARLGRRPLQKTAENVGSRVEFAIKSPPEAGRFPFLWKMSARRHFVQKPNKNASTITLSADFSPLFSTTNCRNSVVETPTGPEQRSGRCSGLFRPPSWAFSRSGGLPKRALSDAAPGRNSICFTHPATTSNNASVGIFPTHLLKVRNLRNLVLQLGQQREAVPP